MAVFHLNVNNKDLTVDVEPDAPLLWVLRDELNLTGAKYGCGIGQCGACTVHFNGTAIRSCSVIVSAAEKGKIVTIEGLSQDGSHPVQQAWDEVDVPQCGYCQTGQIMAAAAFLKKTPKPTTEQIENAMQGNICRCGAYHRIKEAVKVASTKI